MKTLTIQQDQFKKGLQLLEDDSKADFGSARRMLNVLISDRGGITPRPGTEIIGTYSSTGNKSTGLFTFKKTLGITQYPLRGKLGQIEFYHSTEGWQLLKDSFEVDEDFGFTYSLVNTDNEDYSYFCNRFQEYQRWLGAVTQLNGALSGGETTLTVDSTVKAAILESKTATANAATTLDVSGTPWAASQWINFYVYITSGALSGKVRKITANTSSQITFDTLGSAPGNCTFEIRQLAFPASGTLIYGGTTIAYTAIDTATTFAVSSAHAATDNMPVAIVPEVFAGAPRGNRIDNLLGRVLVGNVRSALSRDSGGSLQGSAQAGSIFVSKILTPTDFTFSATRVAGEGDVINVPYGGGDVTDIKAQEEFAYIYKKNYIEAIKYSADTNDVAIRTPLRSGVGSVGRVIKGQNDHYFMTLDKQYTSIGRVITKDTTPQIQNLGLPIKRLLDSYDHSDFNGVEFRNRIISVHRSDSTLDNNDVMLVYNKQTKSFEGVWALGGRFFDIYNDDLIFSESNGANVYKMFTDSKYDKQADTTLLPFTADWKSNFFNALPLKANIQGINSVQLEGYIKGDTTFTFSLYKDFSDTAAISFDFGGDEETFLQGDTVADFLGSNPLGLQPIGTIDAPGSDGRRRFSFIVYFPYQYGQYFSTGISSSGSAQDWELIRIGLGLKESVSTRLSNTKVL